MTKINDLHRKWSTSNDYRDAYESLGPEFDLARKAIIARSQDTSIQEKARKRFEVRKVRIAHSVTSRRKKLCRLKCRRTRYRVSIASSIGLIAQPNPRLQPFNRRRSVGEMRVASN